MDIGTFGECKQLTSFSNNISSLSYGEDMFTGCTSLTDFTSELSSLINGKNMFNLCKLNLASVQNIANTIKDLSGLTLSGNRGKITIGIAADLQDNQELADALAAIVAKGWTVTEQYNA